MSPQMLTVSSKGQITLPVSFRNMLSIGKGSKIAAFATDDSIMLKPVEMPTAKDFEKSCKKAQTWAKKEGFDLNDVSTFIKAARS